MERHTRKLAKKKAVETRKARVRHYTQVNQIHHSETTMIGRLQIRYRHPSERIWTDLGIVSEALVTNAALAIVISVMRGNDATTLQNFKYHDSGTGSTAESILDTALITPIGEGRNTGTQENPSTNVWRSVATHTYFVSAAIREHGIFSSVTGGTLLDRSVFSAIDVVANTELEFTYTLTFTGS